MYMSKCYPYKGMGRYQKELGHYYKNFSSISPAADIVESKDTYKIELELPGVAKEEVTIEVNNDTLTVKGEKKSSAKTEDEKTASSERYYGSFEKQFSLPNNIKNEEIKASYNNGVLELIIPKTEETKPKSIKID